MNKLKILLMTLAIAGISEGAQPSPEQSKDVFAKACDVLTRADKRKSLYGVFNYRNLSGASASKTNLLESAKGQLGCIFVNDDIQLSELAQPEYQADGPNKHALFFWVQSISDNKDRCYIAVRDVTACEINGQPTGAYRGKIILGNRIKNEHALYSQHVETFATLTDDDTGRISKTEKVKTTTSLTKAGKACVAIGTTVIATVAVGLKYKEKIAAAIKGLKKVAVVS